MDIWKHRPAWHRRAGCVRTNGHASLLEALEARRMLSAGDLDPTFGNGGVLMDPRGGSGPVAMVTQKPGGGQTYLLVADAHGIERLRTDGSIDPTFGTNGRARIGKGWFVDAMTLQPDGEILVAGSVGPVSSSAQQNTSFIERLSADGHADVSFGSGGVVHFAAVTGARGFYLDRLLVRPNGKIVGLGTYFGESNALTHSPLTETAVVQFNADGSLDTTFASGGTLVPPTGDEISAADAVLEGDGTLLLVGGQGIIPAARTLTVTAAGAVGTLTPSPSRSYQYFYYGAVARGDGSIVLMVGGSPSGTSFDGGATVVPSGFNTGLAVYWPDKFAGLAGGKFLKVGTGINAFGVTRLNADGTPDATFGFAGTGAVRLSSHSSAHQSSRVQIAGVSELDDGSVVVVASWHGRRVVVKFQGGAHSPTNSGPVSLGAVDVPPQGLGYGSTYTSFAVTYGDESPVEASSIDGADLIVTGPNGFSEPVTLSSGDTPAGFDQSPMRVSYNIAPPGGTWDGADNGTYQIRIQPNQVFDTQGRAAAPAVIDTFTVNLPYADALAIQPTLTNVKVRTQVGGTRIATITVRYGLSGGYRLDGSSLGDDDLVLHAPGGVLLRPKLLNAGSHHRGLYWLATYIVELPGTVLDPKAGDGRYVLHGPRVSSTLGHVAPGGSFGRFRVSGGTVMGL